MSVVRNLYRAARLANDLSAVASEVIAKLRATAPEGTR